MPRLSKDTYAAQRQIVLELASRSGGVCRNEIMKAIECSRPRAEVLVKELRLTARDKDGRVQYFGPPIDNSVIEVITSESMTVATKPLKVNTEIALLESKVKKLAGELEIARARLVAATIKAQSQD